MDEELKDPSLFLDLPMAIADEMIQKARELVGQLKQDFTILSQDRSPARLLLEKERLILSESELGYNHTPTTCGVDGSYAIERLLVRDLVACAAVAVEGLIPPSEVRHWEQPHHKALVRLEPHHSDTATIIRTLMLGYELIEAVKAPHQVVMLDGTLTLPIIYFNQALSRVKEASSLSITEEFLNSIIGFLEAYAEILSPPRTDKHYVGLPKYSSRRELGHFLGLNQATDDRSFLTLILKSGELVMPRPIEQPEREWHLGVDELPEPLRDKARDLANAIIGSLKQVMVTHYKPFPWLPALRIEIPQRVGNNYYRLGTVIQGIKHQCATPSMLEPYPLYLADRMVKALGRSIPSFRQVTTQRVAEELSDNIDEVYILMHGYRSELGQK